MCDQAITLETESEFLARMGYESTAEKTRIATAYPCLIEVRLPELPRTLDGLREALTAFVRELGLPYEIDAGDLIVYGAQSVRIDLTDVDAVAPKRPDEPDDNLDRRLAELVAETNDSSYWSMYRVYDDRDMERRGQVGHGCD